MGRSNNFYLDSTDCGDKVFRNLQKLLKSTRNRLAIQVRLGPGEYEVDKDVLNRRIVFTGTVEDTGKTVKLSRDPVSGIYIVNQTLNPDETIELKENVYQNGIIDNQFWYPLDFDTTQEFRVFRLLTRLTFREQVIDCAIKVNLCHLVLRKPRIQDELYGTITTVSCRVQIESGIQNLVNKFVWSLVGTIGGNDNKFAKLTIEDSAMEDPCWSEFAELDIRGLVILHFNIFRPRKLIFIDRLSAWLLEVVSAFGTVSNVYVQKAYMLQTNVDVHQNFYCSAIGDHPFGLEVDQTSFKCASDARLNIKAGTQNTISLNLGLIALDRGSVLKFGTVANVYAMKILSSTLAGETDLQVLDNNQGIDPKIFNISRSGKVALSDNSFANLPNGPDTIFFEDAFFASTAPGNNTSVFPIQQTLGEVNASLSSLVRFQNP